MNICGVSKTLYKNIGIYFTKFIYFKMTPQELCSEIQKIINKPIKLKPSNDLILGALFKPQMVEAHKLKILQMRLGKIWEVLSEYYGFIKVKKIDLIHPVRKIAIELKNRTNTDNSSSRYRNYQKLLEFKEQHPEFKLYYVCINDRRSSTIGGNETQGKEEKLLANGITFVCGETALKLLYGEDYKMIIELIKHCFQQACRALAIFSE